MTSLQKYGLGFLGIAIITVVVIGGMGAIRRPHRQVADDLAPWMFTDAAEFAAEHAYVTLIDWPPQVQTVNEPFSCNQAGAENEQGGKTELVVIYQKPYCRTVVSEGAAGSTYRQYAYATAVGQGTQIATFTLRFPQCDNYDEPNRSSCKSEQAAFNADTLIVP